MKDFVDSIARQWKDSLNRLEKVDFDKYRFKNMHYYEKGDFVSRGSVKLQQILALSGLKLRGDVVDQGCGRGAWCQLAATMDG